jgi:hypothetical protein
VVWQNLPNVTDRHNALSSLVRRNIQNFADVPATTAIR